MVLLMLLTSGCGAGWRTRTGPWPEQLETRQQVQVWSAGEARRWHAVRFADDSISVVPYLDAPACDSCRLALPLAVVDSIRTGEPVRGFWRSVALGVGASFVLLVLACRHFESCNWGN